MRHAAPTPLLSRPSAKLGTAALLATGSVGGTLLTSTLFADAASTYTVTSLADTGAAGTLRWAITQANADPGSTIVFAGGVTGTITLGSSLPTITASTTITGPGAASLTIDENGSHRIFQIGTAVTATVSGLTLTNSAGSNSDEAIGVSGGGTFAATGITIDNVDATNIGGTGIAPIHCLNGNLSLTSSTVTRSSADAIGHGLLEISGCNTTITSSRLTDNTGAMAVLASQGTLTITSSTISGNSTRFETLSSQATTTILSSTISGNTSSGSVVNLAGGSTTIGNSTISGNTGLAALFVYARTMKLLQSTITANTVTNAVMAQGGYAHSTLETVGTIISGNSGNNVAQSSSLYFANWASEASVLGPSTMAITTDNGRNQTNVTNPGLGALTNNGGPTLTHALLPGSPALDAGPLTVPSFTGNQWDQRGNGYLRNSGAGIDVGAFEVQAPPPPTITTSTSTTSSSTTTTSSTTTSTSTSTTSTTVAPGTTTTAPRDQVDPKIAG